MTSNLRAVDDLLGRDLEFRRVIKRGTVCSRVTVVAWDPARGWKLDGPRFTPAWVPFAMFNELLKTGVLSCA